MDVQHDLLWISQVVHRPHTVFALNHFPLVNVGHVVEARFELVLLVLVVALRNHQIEDGVGMTYLFDLAILLLENLHSVLAH